MVQSYLGIMYTMTSLLMLWHSVKFLNHWYVILPLKW